MTNSQHEQSNGLCPVKFFYLRQNQKYGTYRSSVQEDIECPSTCEGMRSEPRKIGRVILPQIFDKMICGEVVGPNSIDEA